MLVFGQSGKEADGMRVGLLGARVATAALLVLFAAAPAASAHPASRSAASSGWELAPVPARLVPAARALLRAPRSDRIAHWSRRSSNAQDTSSRPALPRIVGGTGAAQGQFGFMAFIVYFDSGGKPDFLCSGTLVSSNVVLTAGHCAVEESTGARLAASGYRVVTGAADWTDKAHRTISRASRVVVNPGFTISGGIPRHDAALLVLSTPVGQPTVPLWGKGQASAGEPAVIAGWGETFAGQTASPTLLQWARTAVQSPSYCRQFNPAFDSSSQLCIVHAPIDDTATCNGDSGGPLLATDANNRLFEIGVTSVGPADCDTNTADYFTAVRPVQAWVSSVVRAVAPGPKIPRLTLAAARAHVRQTLTRVLGSVFRHRHGYRPSCSRDSAIRVGCKLSFTSGANYHHGTVTISYVLVSGKVDWTDRYVIHSVNDRCYFHSGHRSSCQAQTRSGS